MLLAAPAATSRGCRTGYGTSHGFAGQDGPSAAGQEVALAPRQKDRGTCVQQTGSAKGRDVSSCRHLVLGLTYVFVRGLGFAGTLVPLSAAPKGLAGGSGQAQFMFLLIHS